jgi:hypothetical protein
MSLRFTRYLYETSEVKLSLLMSILNKNIDKALFWAFELFYSGYKEELTKELWTIFYDFYATLNPSFEQYLLKKIKIAVDDANTLGAIIHNMIIRPYNVDIFILKYIDLSNDNVVESKDNLVHKDNFIDLLKSEDYVKIANYILNTKSIDLHSVLNTSIEFFINDCNVKLNSAKEIKIYKNATNNNLVTQKRTVLLSRILYYFHLKHNTKLGKNIFIQIEPNDYIQYETVNTHKPPYKILSLTTKYNIDEEEYLSLFCLQREKKDIVTAYRNNWEYYASFSPIWYKRFHRHNGTINHAKKSIDFASEDDQELFYDTYGLEPDEQTLATQEKSIHSIKNTRNWLDFYKKHNINGITQLHENVNKIIKIVYNTM